MRKGIELDQQQAKLYPLAHLERAKTLLTQNKPHTAEKLLALTLRVLDLNLFDVPPLYVTYLDALIAQQKFDRAYAVLDEAFRHGVPRRDLRSKWQQIKRAIEGTEQKSATKRVIEKRLREIRQILNGLAAKQSRKLYQIYRGKVTTTGRGMGS